LHPKMGADGDGDGLPAQTGQQVLGQGSSLGTGELSAFAPAVGVDLRNAPDPSHALR
jgi:hypothetical protein